MEVELLGSQAVQSREFPKKIAYRNTRILDFAFENGSNEVTVSPEEKVFGRLSFSLEPKGGEQVLRQILIGIKEMGAKKMLLSERRIIGKRLEGFMGVDDQKKVYEHFSKYSKNFSFQAPQIPGLYEVQIALLEFPAQPLEKQGTLYGFFELSETNQKLLKSEDSLKILWDLESKIFKISMGSIRVI